MQQTKGANVNVEAKKKQTDNNANANNTVDATEDKKKVDDEDKITVQITVPPDGGWGWVVLLTAFFIYCINYGILFSYGNVIEEFKRSLNLSLPLAALINSVSVASYLCSGPLVSGLINRFGFRFCAMFGAAIAAVANLAANLIETFGALLFFSGIVAGFGYSMSSMSAMIILGFYFSEWRAFAFTTAITGGSTGIFLFGMIYGSITNIDGWRTNLLLQSSLLAVEYFAAICFRPLLTVTVEKKNKKQNTHKATLSSEAESKPQTNGGKLKTSDEDIPLAGRIFHTQPNSSFPTVAEIISEPQKGNYTPTDDSVPGPSNDSAAKLELIFNNPDEEFHHKEMEMVKSMVAETHIKHGESKNKLTTEPSTIEVSVASIQPEPKKRGFWKSLFHWEKHVEESRPMYRDDVFYESSIKNLHLGPKTTLANKSLEYQLEVSRAAATSDLNERNGVFTTAVRRILKTMLNPQILRKKTFCFVCFGMFFVHLGYLIPLVYITIRGKELDISVNYYTMFVSYIGISSIFGRIALGHLALKVDPLAIAALAYFIAGLSTIVSCFLTTEIFQFLYCFIYGFVTSAITVTRALYLVQLYGLDHLSNTTGIIVIFQGVGCLLGTPIGGMLKESFNFQATFIFAAICFFTGSLCHFIVFALFQRETKLNAKNHMTNMEKYHNMT